MDSLVWLTWVISVAVVPAYVEPVTLFGNAQPMTSWQNARQYAEILHQCKPIGSRHGAKKAHQNYQIFRQFPRAVSGTNDYRLWRLVATKPAVLDGHLVAALERLSTSGGYVILAIDVDPETLTPIEWEQLEELGFRKILR